MKNLKLLTIFILFLTPYCANSIEVRAHKEISKNDNAYGVSFMMTSTTHEPEHDFKLGISINHISSNQALAINNRDYINPMYVFVNYSLNYTVSPFIEAGFDLGDHLINDTFDRDQQDRDAYYALGLSLKLNKSLSLAAYYKKYYILFIPDPTFPEEIDRVNLSLTGISLSYRF